MQKYKTIIIGSISGALAYFIVNTLIFKEPLVASIIGGLVIGIVSLLGAILLLKRRESVRFKHHIASFRQTGDQYSYICKTQSHQWFVYTTYAH